MTEPTQSPPSQSVPGTAELRVDRTGTRRYVGRSSRGARVEIGSDDVEGVFTPGELLKIALGACTAMASDFTVSRRLGEDYTATVRITGDADRDTERYPHFEESYHLDLTDLDPATADRVVTAIRRSVDATCTVGRTLAEGADITLSLSTGKESGPA